jgi:hypothetical protein
MQIKDGPRSVILRSTLKSTLLKNWLQYSIPSGLSTADLTALDSQ